MPPGYLAICVDSSRGEKRATSRDVVSVCCAVKFVQIAVSLTDFKMASKIVFLIVKKTANLGFKSVYLFGVCSGDNFFLTLCGREIVVIKRENDK